MKNKLLAVLLAMVIVLLAFASCDKCDHPLSEEWESDANGHWHPTTCEHGEFRGASEAHVDANEDGTCDICAFKGAHIHTFASEWTVTEEKHWKEATCSHTDVKGEESLHVDEDLNGECDVCKTHVHILDGAGFCAGCNKEIIPVDEDKIGSVISATTARTHNIKNGTIDYYQLSSFKNAEDNGVIEHFVEFVRGSNGTYVKMSYDEVETIGEHPNAVVNKTGKTEILEKWIKELGGENVEGISAISVDGDYKEAAPSAFGPDDLAGYYYAISNLADGHGAEALLLSLYNAYDEYGIEDAVIVHDAEANTYSFGFKALIANKITVGGEESEEYAANYFEVSLTFKYDNDYTLLSLDLTCDCYTNDPGSGVDFNREEEIDFDYNYADGTFVMREDARPDTYEISVVQTVGEREEIELNDGSEFAPTGYDIYTDDEYTTKMPTSLTLEITDKNTEFYLKGTPEESFISFLAFDFDITVTDKNGNPTNGLMVILHGYDVIQFFPQQGGEYKVTFEGLGQTKTIDVTVNAPEVKGEHFFTVDVLESYSWSDTWGDDGVYYEFTAEVAGQYTFYLPVNFGIVEKSKWDKGGYNAVPDVDPFNVDASGGYDPAAEHSVTVTIRPGQTYCFYFAATVAGTYAIGYDAP